MKTLQLEHLAPYLPYGVKIEVKTTSAHYATMTGLMPNVNNPKYFRVYDDRFKEPTYAINCYVKPILRPLSDLKTDNISTSTKMANRFDDLISAELFKYSKLKCWQFQYLVKNHFDVFGLIPQGLAIDINTLDNKAPTLEQAPVGV